MAENATALGVIHLKDIVKGGAQEGSRVSAMGIRHHHDHRRQPPYRGGDLRARPVSTTSRRSETEDKMDLIKREQAKGSWSP